jgi:hypothetical protein
VTKKHPTIFTFSFAGNAEKCWFHGLGGKMFKVYVGENDHDSGHYVGTYPTIRGARRMATLARKEYEGDGWSKIQDQDSSWSERTSD